MCELLGFALSASWTKHAQDISYMPHRSSMTKLCTQIVHMDYMLSREYTQAPFANVAQHVEYGEPFEAKFNKDKS